MRERATSPLTITSKQPFRGFSSFTTTFAPGKPAFTSASNLVARVLNAPQDLHASILTTALPDEDEAGLEGAAAFGAALGFLVMVFFGAICPTRGRRSDLRGI